MSNPLDGGFILGAYWGPREESLTACTRRLAECLQGLAEVSTIFDGWYRKGHTRAAASREPIGRTRTELKALLESGRHRTDFGGEVMADLGFSAELWNRQTKGAAAWSVLCGAFPPPGVGVSNYFVIDWPERAAGVTVEQDLPTARAAMEVVVQAWAPEWSTWTSRGMRDLQEAPPGHAALGLLTYFGADRPIPPLDSAATSEQLQGGQLVVLKPTADDLPSRLLRLRSVLAASEVLRERT